MEITTKENFMHYKDIFLRDGDKCLCIIYARVLDVFWVINDNEIDNNGKLSSTFYISKNDTILYDLFNELISSVKNKDVNNYLYNRKNDTITWISDSTNEEVANEVSIRNINDQIILEFKRKPYKFGKGYIREMDHLNQISIRFSNSGSRYDPLDSIFMNMYNKLQNINLGKEKSLSLK